MNPHPHTQHPYPRLNPHLNPNPRLDTILDSHQGPHGLLTYLITHLRTHLLTYSPTGDDTRRHSLQRRQLHPHTQASSALSASARSALSSTCSPRRPQLRMFPLDIGCRAPNGCRGFFSLESHGHPRGAQTQTATRARQRRAPSTAQTHWCIAQLSRVHERGPLRALSKPPGHNALGDRAVLRRGGLTLRPIRPDNQSREGTTRRAPCCKW